MIPHAMNALTTLAGRLMATILPDLKSTYTMSDGAMLGLLMNAIAPEIENGIARRLDDIESMKLILADQKEYSKLVAMTPSSMSLSDVNALHDQLTEALISLHESVDVTNPNSSQIEVNEKIWTYLNQHVARHRLNLP